MQDVCLMNLSLTSLLYLIRTSNREVIDSTPVGRTRNVFIFFSSMLEDDFMAYKKAYTPFFCFFFLQERLILGPRLNVLMFY